jgi:pyruvate kinase
MSFNLFISALFVIGQVSAFHVGSSLPRLISSDSSFKRSTLLMAKYDKGLVTPIPVIPRRWKKSTKQLATLGPASNSIEMIEKLFLSGADVFRLNFSHGEHSEKANVYIILIQSLFS